MGMVYNRAAANLLGVATAISWSADTIKARLSRTSETLTDKDVTVMTGIALPATDVVLGTKTGPTQDDATDRVKYGCATITFAAVAAGAEVNKIVVFKFVVNDAGSTPIAVVDITAITPNGGDIVVTINAAGLFYLQE